MQEGSDEHPRPNENFRIDQETVEGIVYYLFF